MSYLTARIRTRVDAARAAPASRGGGRVCEADGVEFVVCPVLPSPFIFAPVRRTSTVHRPSKSASTNTHTQHDGNQSKRNASRLTSLQVARNVLLHRRGVLRLAREPRQGAGAVRRAAGAVAAEEGRREGSADGGVDQEEA
jgi:hypothetical protein